MLDRVAVELDVVGEPGTSGTYGGTSWDEAEGDNGAGAVESDRGNWGDRRAGRARS